MKACLHYVATRLDARFHWPPLLMAVRCHMGMWAMMSPEPFVGVRCPCLVIYELVRMAPMSRDTRRGRRRLRQRRQHERPRPQGLSSIECHRRDPTRGMLPRPLLRSQDRTLDRTLDRVPFRSPVPQR